MNLRYDGVGMLLFGRLLDGRTAVIWLLPAILVVIAIVLPVVAWKRYPPTDPWFEERRRVRGERPNHDQWMPEAIGVVIALSICVGPPLLLATEIAKDAMKAGISPEYTIATITAVVVIGELIVLVVMPTLDVRYFKKLRRQREGYTPGEFIAHFARLGVRADAALEVREHLQIWWTSVPDFPVLPSDSLEDVYRMDVGDEFRDILHDCWCREPTDADAEAVPRLDTVEDLVRLVDRLYLGRTTASS